MTKFDDKAIIERVADKVYKSIIDKGLITNNDAQPDISSTNMLDITSKEAKADILLKEALDIDMLSQMKSKTVARIGIGRSGLRLNTRTALTLRADHAAAKDAVFKYVDQDLLKSLNLFSVQTKCQDKNMYLTRPDLGKIIAEDDAQKILDRCSKNPQVQIIVSDGLSSTAIEANIANIMPIISVGLTTKGIQMGTPFFIKYGRVGAMDHVSELLGATVTCILIGERPGLATAASMSAYIAYKATVGMPEARRTVISNIHADGINSVEAGAYICEVIQNILKHKASGVELVGS